MSFAAAKIARKTFYSHFQDRQLSWLQLQALPKLPSISDNPLILTTNLLENRVQRKSVVVRPLPCHWESDLRIWIASILGSLAITLMLLCWHVGMLQGF